MFITYTGFQHSDAETVEHQLSCTTEPRKARPNHNHMSAHGCYEAWCHIATCKALYHHISRGGEMRLNTPKLMSASR